MNKEDQIEYTPPYLSNAKLEHLFGILSTRSFQTLSPDDLQTRNFSNSDSFLGINTLKFLKMLDANGNVLDNMRVLLLRGNENQKRLQEIIKQAYHKLYLRVPNAEKLKRDELYNEFISEYRLSSRVAKPTVSAFLWLCKKAGLEVTEEAPISPGRKLTGYSLKPYKKTYDKEIKKTLEEQPSLDVHTFNISGIKLLIPKSEKVDDAIVAGELAIVRQAIITFAKRVGLVREGNNTNQEIPLLGDGSE